MVDAKAVELGHICCLLLRIDFVNDKENGLARAS
jgi:hypothetical protein